MIWVAVLLLILAGMAGSIIRWQRWRKLTPQPTPLKFTWLKAFRKSE
jgi:hypothetical protein